VEAGVCRVQFLEIAMARIRETDVSGERFDRAHDIQVELPKRQGLGAGAWLGVVIFSAALAVYAYTQGAMG
jgi:hypothetical protein